MLFAFVHQVVAYPVCDGIHVMRGIAILFRLGLPVYRDQFVLIGFDADLFLTLPNECLLRAFVALNIPADEIPDARPNGLGRRTKTEKYCVSRVEEHGGCAPSELISH